MARLDGKVAFISGVARGQGRAHAIRLASEGANIVGFDICAPVPTTKHPPATLEDLAETVRLVEATGRSLVARQADARDFDAVKATLDEGLDRFGRLDIVIANAGIFALNLLWEITEEQWHTMIDVNLGGVWRVAKAAMPVLIEQGEGGVVIMISSTAGLRGIPYQAHYTAAKHGVVGLARSLAIEGSRYGIRVHSVHPTGVDTPLIDEPDLEGRLFSDRQALATVSNALHTPRLLAPEDVANVVAFLASDEARGMTGTQTLVDLGNSLL